MNQLTPEVLILGMHRSGTSMIGAVLQALGVNLGQDSPGKQVSNPLGHFEDGDFLDLNNTILFDAGGAWDNPPDPQILSSLAEKYQQAAKDLVQTKTRENSNQIWGWKDPRTSLTASYYLPFLNNPHLIWCNRYPDEIAASLWKRNKIPREKGLELVAVYQQGIIQLINEHPEIPVLKLEYHEVVQDPGLWVMEICKFLDLNVNAEKISEAVQLILPREKVNREKTTLQLKYLFSLPSRVYKKIFSRSHD
jgi:hypothetical protein